MGKGYVSIFVTYHGFELLQKIKKTCRIIGGWGEGPYREIVSFRSCVRTRGVHCLVGTSPKGHPDLFPFPFLRGRLSLFPWDRKWNQSELFAKSNVNSKWIQSESNVKSKWIHSEIKLNSMWNPCESEWNQCEITVKWKWYQSKIQVNQIEIRVSSKWAQSELIVEAKWNQSEFEVSSKWIRSEPPPPSPQSSYPALACFIGIMFCKENRVFWAPRRKTM